MVLPVLAARQEPRDRPLDTRQCHNCESLWIMHQMQKDDIKALKEKNKELFEDKVVLVDAIDALDCAKTDEEIALAEWMLAHALEDV
jgi:hypothetical protein